MNTHYKLVFGVMILWVAGISNATDSVRVRALAASCANCHGTNGVAQQGMESIAGQTKEELLKKLQDFKAGKKPATIMHQLSKGYTDEQLEALAEYFSKFKK